MSLSQSVTQENARNRCYQSHQKHPSDVFDDFRLIEFDENKKQNNK